MTDIKKYMVDMIYNGKEISREICVGGADSLSFVLSCLYPNAIIKKSILIL